MYGHKKSRTDTDVSSGQSYAIAVRDADHLFEVMAVRHSKKGEFFTGLPRPPRPHDSPIDAHASLHRDGKRHWKTHGAPKFNCIQMQKPNQHFRGTAHLLSQKIVPWHPRDIGVLCDPNTYTDVFEIPISDLRDGEIITRVSVDLVSPGYSPNLGPDIRVLRQREYQEAF